MPGASPTLDSDCGEDSPYLPRACSHIELTTDPETPKPPGVAAARLILMRVLRLRRERAAPPHPLTEKAIQELPKVAKDHARLLELLK